MADLQLYLEAEKRGLLPADKQGLLNEARKRGLVPGLETASQPAAPVTPAPKPKNSFWGEVGQQVGNVGAGLVRGAGSIGASLVAPIDMVSDAVDGKGLSLESNRRRRADMDAALGNMGADTDSIGYGGGKLIGELAGTAGAGGALANGVRMGATVTGRALPAAADALMTSIASAGMKTGAAQSFAANVGTRAAGGAINGGVTSALATGDPKDALIGAVIGGALPPAMMLANKAGQAVGSRAAAEFAEASAKFGRDAPKRETIKAAVDAGYVVPPNMVNPSLKNATLESFSGKQATGQLASVKNQNTTEKLVRQSLGLADDAPLSRGALEQIRKVEGGAYRKVSNVSPQAELDLETLKQARNNAQGWFNAYNRSASPADLAQAKNFRDVAEVFELKLESHALNAGKPELIPQLQAARKQIAKTYTVERALNNADGTVDAKVFGRLYEKGKPLTDGLDTVGRFASAFPQVNQAASKMGSPGAHNLRAGLGALLAGAGTAAAGPAGLAAFAFPYAAGSASRGLMFSKATQQALANPTAPTLVNANRLSALLQNQQAQEAIARSAPALIVNRN